MGILRCVGLFDRRVLLRDVGMKDMTLPDDMLVDDYKAAISFAKLWFR
jgi:hypothetical protein